MSLGHEYFYLRPIARGIDDPVHVVAASRASCNFKIGIVRPTPIPGINIGRIWFAEGVRSYASSLLGAWHPPDSSV